MHPPRNIDAVRLSLERFGQRKPIVTRDGVIVAGNGTHRAAVELGWTEIAAVDAVDLTPEMARAYGIADNKTGELAEWDHEKLSQAFREMESDLRAVTGFAGFEIEPLLAAVFGDGKKKADDPAKTPDDLVTLHFQVSGEQNDGIGRALEQVKKTGGASTDGEALFAVCRAVAVG